MSTSAEIVNPASDEVGDLGRVLSFFEAQEEHPGKRAFYLCGAGTDDRVELTEQLSEILRGVVQALSHGQSISILTRDQEVSTQQAAEILGLSRPTVVRLIEDGELQAHVPGTIRRKLRLADVLTYREELRARRNKFITESSEEFEDFADDEVSGALAEARRRG